jgi:Flp pilus assembly protein TadG
MKETSMLPNVRRDGAERGQVLVIVGVGMVAIIALVALVIDGGYAWAKQRDTQNAADAMAHAGTVVLMQNLVGVQPARTDGDVAVAVDQAAAENEVDLRVAHYTNFDGDLITPAGGVTTDETAAAQVGDGVIPPGAFGVRAVAEQDFDTFLAQVVGFTEFTSAAPATARTGWLSGVCPAEAGCILLPLTFPVNMFDCDGTNKVKYLEPESFWPNPSEIVVVPLCSSGPGNVGWIDWTPPAGGTAELRAAIANPSNPAITWPEWYRLTETGGPDAVEPEMRLWDGKRVLIPLFDLTCNTTPSGPGVTDCPPANVGGTGPHQWTHLAAVTTFELCGTNIPECVAAGFNHGSYIQGSNGGPGGICATGNGATDCLVGRFITTSYTGGPLTSTPPPAGVAGTPGVNLIRGLD